METDERWKQDGVRVIPGTELDPNTAQTLITGGKCRY